MTNVAIQSWICRRCHKFSFELCCDDVDEPVVHSIRLPRSKVAQCLLLAELLATDDDCILEGNVPVPLAVEEVEAWLSFQSECTYTNVFMFRALKVSTAQINHMSYYCCIKRLSCKPTMRLVLL